VRDTLKSLFIVEEWRKENITNDAHRKKNCPIFHDEVIARIRIHTHSRVSSRERGKKKDLQHCVDDSV
jgi:hypothetical protein